LYVFPDVDIITLNANERRNTAERLVNQARQESLDAERSLTEMGVKTIHAEGKYAEKHAKEIEDERKEYMTGNYRTDESSEDMESDKTEDAEKKSNGDESESETEQSKFDGFVEIFDKWGCGEDDR